MENKMEERELTELKNIYEEMVLNELIISLNLDDIETDNITNKIKH